MLEAFRTISFLCVAGEKRYDSPAEELTTTQRGRNLSRNFRSGHHNIGFRCAR